MKKRAIRFDWWEAIVEVDLTTQTLELMKEQLLFWMGGQQMIDDADGCIETAYLRMLGQALIRESMDLTLTGIIKEYESKEGWVNGDAEVV